MELLTGATTNRTIVELKHISQGGASAIARTTNRTIVELKPGFNELNKATGGLPIVP